MLLKGQYIFTAQLKGPCGLSKNLGMLRCIPQQQTGGVAAQKCELAKNNQH
jgi:hypothetical protein